MIVTLYYLYFQNVYRIVGKMSSKLLFLGEIKQTGFTDLKQH